MMLFRRLLTIVVVALAVSVKAQTEGYWDKRFCPCGIEWSAGTTHYDDGKFYFGGDYLETQSVVQGARLSPPIVWDGRFWSSLGGGVKGTDPDIFQILSDSGHVYISGSFSQAGNVSANGLARWDKQEQQWEAFEDISLQSGSGARMQLDSTYLYVLGDFIVRDTLARVARWDTKERTWEILCHTNLLNQGDYFTDMLVVGEKLYVTGDFSLKIGATKYEHIAGLDLTSREWFQLDKATEIRLDSNGYGKLPAYKIFRGRDSLVYFFGWFSVWNRDSNVQIASKLVEWNGSTWANLLPKNSTFNVSDVSIHSYEDHLYVSGAIEIPTPKRDTIRNVASWDGYEWWPEIKNSSEYRLRAQGCLKVNGQMYAGDKRWNGQYFVPVDSGLCHGMDDEISAIYADKDTIYAAGPFVYGGGVLLNGIGKWGGNEWAAVGQLEFKETSNPEFNAIIKFKGDLYIGGAFTALIDGEEIYNCIKYDGSKWSAAFPKKGDDYISRIFCFESSGDSLLIGGDPSYLDSSLGSVVVWSREKLSFLGNGFYDPNTSSQVRDLLSRNGIVYAVGDFRKISSGEVNRVAQWSNGEWRGFGDPENVGIDDQHSYPKVNSLGFYQDTLFVAGSFTSLWGAPAYGLAKFDGGLSFIPVDGNPAFGIIASDNKNLYLCGGREFTPLYPQFYNQGNTYNINNWGIGLQATLAANNLRSILILSEDKIAYAGNISLANGIPSRGLAIWHQTTASVGKSNDIENIYPNPASSSITVDIPEYAGNSSVILTDLLGRVVPIQYEELGKQLKLDVTPIPEGVYTIVVNTGNRVLRNTIVIAR